MVAESARGRSRSPPAGGHGGKSVALFPSQQPYIDKEDKHGAHNYHPLPVVLERGKGCFMWDTDGKKYFDFLAAYSAVNQGHCHPRIVAKLTAQAEKLTLTSRAFHNSVYPGYTEFICKFFGYDKVLPMNTGVEGTETATKLMRRWGYLGPRKVKENQARVVFAEGNFWGRSIAALSSSTDPDCYDHFGPYAPGFPLIPYNDLPAFKKLLEQDAAQPGGPTIVGVCLEPIQGEAGINVPSDDYFPGVRELCNQYNVLLCCDEIQTGLARTGKMLCQEHYGIRADLVVLGKALSGGCYPVSAVLTDDKVMQHVVPGCHGSTYGGNPLGCAIAAEALQVLKDESMVQNAEKLGKLFRAELTKQLKESGLCPFVKDIRGKGLLNAVECDPAFSEHVTAWQICMELAREGLLAKPTHNNIIRFAPPLCISEAELGDALSIIKRVFHKHGKNTS